MANAPASCLVRQAASSRRTRSWFSTACSSAPGLLCTRQLTYACGRPSACRTLLDKDKDKEVDKEAALSHHEARRVRLKARALWRLLSGRAHLATYILASYPGEVSPAQHITHLTTAVFPVDGPPCTSSGKTMCGSRRYRSRRVTCSRRPGQLAYSLWAHSSAAPLGPALACVALRCALIASACEVLFNSCVVAKDRRAAELARRAAAAGADGFPAGLLSRSSKIGL